MPQRTGKRELQTTSFYPQEGVRVAAMTSRGRAGPVGLKVVASERGCGLLGLQVYTRVRNGSWLEKSLSAPDIILPN